MRKLWTGILAALGILILILDTNTALNGANEGIKICLYSVIPSLFPFFVLSMLLTSSFSGARLPGFRRIGKLCGIPNGQESVLLVGLLGGYPVGAQSVADLYRSGKLSKSDAVRMLGFCSNAGPAFFFGIVAGKFSESWMGLALWLIHLVSALAVGMILPGKGHHHGSVVPSQAISFSTALKRSIQVTAQVSGWVILFRIVIAYLNRWLLWAVQESFNAVIIGIMELANGCCELEMITDESLRFIAASAMLAFGGLCVTMQTISVTSGLGLGCYIQGKLLQTVISICFAWFIMRPMIHPAIILAICGIICHEMKKRSSNPATVVV